MSLDSEPSDQLVIAAPGASAGDLAALEKSFNHMPRDAGIALILAQYLVADRLRTPLAYLLPRASH